MTRMIATGFVMLSVILSALSATSQTLTVRCVPMAPLKYTDSSGKLTGLEVDLVRALFACAGFVPEFVDHPWSRALNDLKHGKIDILTSFSYHEDRKAFAHYLGISTYEQTILIVKRENRELKIEKLDDFIRRDTLFGIRDNFFYSEEFNHRYKSDPEFRSHFDAGSEPANELINFRKVVTGRITGCFGDMILSGFVISSHEQFRDLVIIRTPVFRESPVYFAASKKMSPYIYARLEKSYQQLENQGVLNRIRAGWLKQVTPEN